MRSMLAVAVAIGVSTGAVSHAATLSYTSAPIMQTYTPQSTGERVVVDSPDFDPSLGDLTSVSYTIFGSATDDLVGENGNNIVFPATYTNYVGAYGPGFSQYQEYSQDSGSASTSRANNSFAINLTVDNLNSLNFYEPPGTNEFEFQAISFVSNTSTGKNVYYSDDTATFDGTVTETFTYSPVPEPGSLPVFMVAVLTLLGVAGYRRFSSVP